VNRLKLTPSDWRIIYCLQDGDPWEKSFSTVATQTGLSTRTVKKRVGMLVEDGTIYLLAGVNLSSFEGFVPAHLTIFYQSPESRNSVYEKVRDSLRDMLVFADIEDKHHGYFALSVPSVARIRQIESWAKTCDGVRNARVEISAAGPGINLAFANS
jgi:DNA-binding Lrp family transcriptional regulator